MSRIKAHKPFDYVEGDFPKAMKFHGELNDKDIRQIQDNGSKVVMLAPDYKLPDLDDARKQCSEFRSSDK